MRALRYDEVGGPIRMTEVPSPRCPPDGVVIAVAATGVCRSDWHAWRGHEQVPLPQVPGHEFAGVVAEIGPAVQRFAVGDRVTAPFVNGCGRCVWCRGGEAQICPDQNQPGFTDPGSFAERVVVRAADFNLVALPDAVDFVTAAALGCRFATAFHALTTRARVRSAEWVAVYGCGGVGLSTIMVAKSLGARVVAVDPSPAARGLAAELGADVVVDNRTEPDPALAVRRATDGGAQVSVDAVGSAVTVDAAVRSLRRRGRHIQVGLMGDAPQAPVPWELVIGHELEVLGSHGMAAVEYPKMIAMITVGRLDPRRLVGSVIDLATAGAALAAMDQPVPADAGIVVATV